MVPIYYPYNTLTTYKIKTPMAYFESLHMTFYLCLIVTICDDLRIRSTQTLNNLEFDLQGHSRSNLMSYFESPHMTSYLCLIVTMGVSSSV